MENPLPTAARDTFLAHFPQNKRGTIANWFLRPIREHADDPQIVVSCVLADLYRRLENAWASEKALADASAAIEIIQEHRAEALAFAAYYVAYERLPDAERAASKEHERQGHKDAWMTGQPPSDRQLTYLRSLGYAGTPASMREASEAIDRLLATRGKAARR